MPVTELVSKLSQTNSIEALVTAASGVRARRPLQLSGISVPARIATVATLARTGWVPLLIVVSRQDVADQLAGALDEYLDDQSTVRLWPTSDALPYEMVPVDRDASARRIEILDALQRRDAGVTIVPARGLTQYLSSPQDSGAGTLSIRSNERLDVEKTIRRLLDSGYQMVKLVREPGQMSRRGGIIDIFPPTEMSGIRVDLFGDEVESLRRFDPESQRSTQRISSVTARPPFEISLAHRTQAVERIKALDLSQLRDEVRDEWSRILRTIEYGDPSVSLEIFSPYLLDHPVQLLDYLPVRHLVIVIEPGAVQLALHQSQSHAEEVRMSLEASGEIPAGLPVPYFDTASVLESLQHRRVIYFGEGAESFDTRPIDEYPDGLGYNQALSHFTAQADAWIDQIRTWWRDGWDVVVATEQSERVRELLREQGLAPGSSVESGGSLNISHSSLQPGWTHPEAKLALITDRELFGYRREARARRRRQRRQPGLLESLTPGQYVVHVEHGIARYDGLTTLDTAGAEREYLLLQYAGNDRIYLPVDQIDRITRYEGGGVEPRLTRLGSPEWNRAKQRARQSVRELAFELLELYASREANEGVAFEPDTVWDSELEESFPWDETRDQMQAIQDVKADMESSRPMDRLVCGDVGYGKTEVALRAAFKAVNAGFQVAILVPTTILALQHYYSFRERLSPFPVRVAMLSRLRSRQEQREIVESTARGGVDILIGTHRLLQKDVSFSNLGLIVIDEEQRFGVAHKEQLKRLRSNVDVLTMTATPIPRTLHMALSGIRDLSVINTPPQDRIPIRTFVSPSNDKLIRDAILRELGRGGQVYVVHNRVQSIYGVAKKIRELVPEARVGVAHGQMAEEELEAVMLSFVQHEFDVLVCTTIIESGVDIPNTNTIIIDNAQNLGLTQLYQLRGRIGRSFQRAYAYLVFPENQTLSQEAQARLEAIQEATELGAGFQIALRDLEIRGAGNVLGAEQSGHIAAVGFDLYTRMLATAVEEVRQGQPIEEAESVSIDLPVGAIIPPEYAGDEELRIELYKRIASAESYGQLRDLQAELLDRFGAIPEQVQTLFALARLRVRAANLGITSIIERDGEVYIRPVLGTRLDQRELRRTIGDTVYVTPNQVRISLTRARLEPLDTVTKVVAAVEAAGAAVLAAD